MPAPRNTSLSPDRDEGTAQAASNTVNGAVVEAFESTSNESVLTRALSGAKDEIVELKRQLQSKAQSLQSRTSDVAGVALSYTYLRTEQTRDSIRENPIRSVALAAGAGVAVAWMFMKMRERRR